MSKIVVGVDGSEHSRAALLWAAEEAKLRGAVLEVVYVYDYTPAFEVYEYPSYVTGEVYRVDREQAQEQADRLVQDLAGSVSRDGIEVEPIAINDRRPSITLTRQAQGADLLVVGSRGRGGFAGLVLGSVSQQCAHHAPCPVVIIPTGD